MCIVYVISNSEDDVNNVVQMCTDDTLEFTINAHDGLRCIEFL